MWFAPSIKKGATFYEIYYFDAFSITIFDITFYIVQVGTIIMQHPICSFDGCKAKVKRTKKNNRDSYWYSKFCGVHTEIIGGYHEKASLQRKAAQWGVSLDELSEINRNKCIICGWNKTICDVHRVKSGKDGGKYVKENIIVLCPNCHRLVHKELLTI